MILQQETGVKKPENVEVRCPAPLSFSDNLLSICSWKEKDASSSNDGR